MISAQEWSTLWLSLKIAALSSLLLLGPGIACGWLLARKRFPGKIFFESLVHLPLVLPPVVTGVVLLTALGKNGVLGHLLFELAGIRLAFQWEGAVLASMVMAFPLMVRSVRLAVELVDPGLEQASRSLGTDAFRTFLRITLPLAAPGVIAGCLLAFARSLGEFGATITFAGNISGETQTLPLAIYSYLQSPGGEAPILRLAVLSIALSLGTLVVGEALSKRFQHKWEASG